MDVLFVPTLLYGLGGRCRELEHLAGNLAELFHGHIMQAIDGGAGIGQEITNLRHVIAGEIAIGQQVTVGGVLDGLEDKESTPGAVSNLLQGLGQHTAQLVQLPGHCILDPALRVAVAPGEHGDTACAIGSHATILVHDAVELPGPDVCSTEFEKELFRVLPHHFNRQANHHPFYHVYG